MYTFLFNINYLQVTSIFLLLWKTIVFFVCNFQQVFVIDNYIVIIFKLVLQFFFSSDLTHVCEIPHPIFLKNILHFLLFNENSHWER